MNSDLTFITNEKNKTLLDRFKVLIKDTEFFDVLVGYFYTSGFHVLYKMLEKTKKIRILIGISTDKRTVDLLNNAEQKAFELSHAETKDHFSNLISTEMSYSEDNRNLEEGVNKFMEWLQTGKLEIKAYPAQNLHAKLYIMTFTKDDRDKGRVITGSSNFSQAGLVDNLELNVELKNPTDYEFALKKFNELWEDAVDVKDKYIETIKNRTWLNNTITPHELYLKFLYEYFKDEISKTEELFYKYTPYGFKKLEYQEQAVLNAKKILDEYGGVFISDVVGLGKTYVSAILAGQLDGRTLVIAPPVLLDENNPGSWPNVFSDFRVPADFESWGKLDSLINRGVEKYKNIFIDEAHRFRTETNITYEKLAQVCRGKRIILVSATPYNNRPNDILSQIKLFQKSKKSTIPGLPNLELFFSKLENKIKGIDRQKERNKFFEITKDIAKEIREKVLKYLMVRRTRSEIEKYFAKDLKKQGLRFPEVIDPAPIFYELNDEEDNIFNKTIELVTKKFTYARYTPMLDYKGEKQLDQLEIQAQKNMGRFMKILLVKRLESSFYAFKKSIDRFTYSYEKFLEEFDNGNVYVSKKYTNKIFEFLENDDEESIQRLIDEDKANRYLAKDFNQEFRKKLEDDYDILKEIKALWNKINRDPKLLKFNKILSTNKILNTKNDKIIVFSESKETAEYLARGLSSQFKDRVISFTGQSSAGIREKVIENFDANARFPKDDYQILVSTEVLSEGVNLHRSNIVINYDIPWNPTRLMQRVGRINRVDTYKYHDKIFTFNFFPTKQANTEIKLKEAAEAKIQAFITLLGADAKLLTEDESIESHELFSRLISKKTITGEDEDEVSDLKYLNIIKEIRDSNPNLFAKIKHLPKKARTSRKFQEKTDSLLTYFRKGKLQKFFLVGGGEPKELDFISAAKSLEVDKIVKREKLGEQYYKLLDKNKLAFEMATAEEMPEIKKQRGQDNATKILKILKALEKDLRQLTDEQELYFKKIFRQLEEGGIPKPTTKKVFQEINSKREEGINALKIIAILQKNIPAEFLKEHISESAAQTSGPREVILSEYFIKT